MKKILVFCMYLMLLQPIAAQESYMPTDENLKARKWFQDSKFGLFIHWGVYSILGDGEWVMNNQNISIEEYEKLPSFFNPIDFDAKAWVKMAKDAGMKYITITSRHHDGFSMFDTKASEYNIVKKTPYKKDILKALAEACKEENIKLFFYYSLLDWHDNNYFPRGRTGRNIPGRADNGNWESYINFMKAQLTELLTNYGEIGGIWFDGHWDQKDWDGKRFGKLNVDWHYDEIYKLIHDLQPQCLIGNNHHIVPIAGEDFQMFEKDLPGKNSTGFGTAEDAIGELPLEVCETINGSWGFNLKDRRHKSHKELVQYIVNAASYGSNLLLNVGPMPNGKIQPHHVNSLKKIGRWMQNNGNTIYGTTSGPVRLENEIVSTQKGNTIYLHVLDPTNKKVYFIPNFKPTLKSIRFFHGKKKLVYKKTDYGMFLEIPTSEKDEIDTIVELILK